MLRLKEYKYLREICEKNYHDQSFFLNHVKFHRDIHVIQKLKSRVVKCILMSN
jgi:hypothetical protein